MGGGLGLGCGYFVCVYGEGWVRVVLFCGGTGNGVLFLGQGGEQSLIALEVVL